jgi:hypothetical protein
VDGDARTCGTTGRRRAARRAGVSARALLLAGCLALSGCSGSAAREQASAPGGREVAQRFAEAIVRGEGQAAVALLSNANDTPLTWLAKRSAASWKAEHGVVRLRDAPSPGRWVFRYDGMRTHDDGRFEQVRGHILVVVGRSPRGVGVEFFSLRTDDVRYGTHRDSVLLPSNR